jgi:hypothetical protein
LDPRKAFPSTGSLTSCADIGRHREPELAAMHLAGVDRMKVVKGDGENSSPFTGHDAYAAGRRNRSLSGSPGMTRANRGVPTSHPGVRWPHATHRSAMRSGSV